MDHAHHRDTILEEDDPIDAYLLVFWKASIDPDRIIKQTSATAPYWHHWAQALPTG